MSNIKDFFSFKNTVSRIAETDQDQVSNYIESVKAFARITYKSLYIIDYQKKGFEYVSDSPLFLCGHTAREVREMGYEFYFKHVPQPDLDLLIKINTIGFDFYEQISLNERKEYTISYDFHIRNQEGKTVLINQKLTPMFLTDNGKIWKAMCIVSLSTKRKSGNIKIYRKGNHQIYIYDLKGRFWRIDKKVKLSDREKEILQFSIKGYTIGKIAETISVSSETVKFHRRKLFRRLDVNNISEAIMYATDNKLI